MDLHECALDYAQTDIVPLVQPWFNAFLVILVVWTGLTIAFGGTFDMSKVIAIVLTIGFANMLFYYYYLPMPFLGLDRGIPYAIAQGAEVISEEFFTQADGIYYDAFDEAYRELSDQNAKLAQYDLATSGQFFARLGTEVAALTAAGAMAGGPAGAGAGAALGTISGLFNGVAGALESFSTYLWAFIMTVTMWSFLAVLHLVFWIIMAQYLWGYFGLAVLSVVGPIFVPLILLEQTQDYFWGWFRALIQYAFYMITGAAIYAVLAILLSAPLLYGANLEVPVDASTGLAAIIEYFSALWTQHLPVIVMALLASLQVGALSSGLTTGSAPPGAGFLARVGQAAVGAAVIGNVGSRIHDARPRYLERQARVLSERTRTQREAVEAGKATLGETKGSAGGPGAGGPDRSTPMDGGPTVRPAAGSASGSSDPESHVALRDYLKRVRGASSFTEIQRLTERFSKRIDVLHRKEAQSKPLG